jgi:NitT/TauT family transport system ATP-binding protein
MPPQLCVNDLGKSYASPRGDTLALRGLTFSARNEEFVCLVGPSGCGKSTLLRLVAGLTQPSNGSVAFSGWDGGPRCAMVFQDPALFAWLSVVDNVAFGLETQGVHRDERRRRALALLERMGLQDFASHYPHELSGGMRQRAAIARALVTEPQVLLMDEPFRALDAQTRLLLQEDLLRLYSERPLLVLFVTHDIEEAILLGDRVLVLSSRPGRILEELRVPLPRPRVLGGRSYPQVEELRWRIWKLLEPEVRLGANRGTTGV